MQDREGHNAFVYMNFLPLSCKIFRLWSQARGHPLVCGIAPAWVAGTKTPLLFLREYCDALISETISFCTGLLSTLRSKPSNKNLRRKLTPGLYSGGGISVLGAI